MLTRSNRRRRSIIDVPAPVSISRINRNPAPRSNSAYFNGDGHPDLAGVIYDSAHGQWMVGVLLGKGDGTFEAAGSYDVWSYPNSLAMGDFNGEGKPDIAVATYYSVNVLVGNGDGTFQTVQYYYGAGLNPRSVTVADFNGDGKLDIAVADSSGVSILLGKGDGTFQAPQRYAVGGDYG